MAEKHAKDKNNKEWDFAHFTNYLAKMLYIFEKVLSQIVN